MGKNLELDLLYSHWQIQSPGTDVLSLAYEIKYTGDRSLDVDSQVARDSLIRYLTSYLTTVYKSTLSSNCWYRAFQGKLVG